MSPATFLRQLARESRGSRGRLVFFVACLAVGVGAVVSVAGVSVGLETGIRARAKPMLGADLAVRGQRPLTPELEAAIGAIAGAEVARTREMLTLVAAEGGSHPGRSRPGRSRLVELKAVEMSYPFYGRLVLDPARPLPELLGIETTIVAPEVLDRLGLRVGDGLRIGGQSFRITAVVREEPDRIAGAFSMGPRVFLSHEGLERAGLVATGSRVLYRTLVRLPSERDPELETLAAGLKKLLPGDGRLRLETYREAQPSLRQGLERTERYLALAALLSLLIGGVGVAQTVRAWLAGRMDAIAVLKCLGYRPREVLALYLGQAAFLGLLGSVVGALLGVGIQVLATRLLAGVLPVSDFNPFQPLAILRGMAMGLGVALLFSTPPLLAAQRVPPIRVLRRDAEPLPQSRPALAVLALVLVGGVLALAAWQARSLAVGALFTAGLLVLTALLTAAATLLSRLAARPRRLARLWLRHGLAALARPGTATVGAIVALGLGVLVVLGMLLVERRLAQEFERDLPREAPTVFLIDIQPHQWQGVRTLLEREAASRIDSVPVVMARIEKIDGKTTEQLAATLETADGDGRWALTREQRLTYLDQLPADNTLIAGSLWSKPGVAEISAEEEFARELGIGMGSKITFNVQGVSLELEVTSLRKVDWRTFGINFFLVVEPGVLENAPQQRIAAAQVEAGREGEVQDELAAEFPNVTLIQIREVLEKVASILEQLGMGIRLLGLLTMIAGLAILTGTVSASSVRRGTEVALYKTLGLTRREVVATFAVEYALLGLVAGTIGAAGAAALSYFVVKFGFELSWQPHPSWFLLGILGAMALAVGAGLGASFQALARRPIEVLRTEVG